MNTINNRLIATGLLFIITLLSGVWLSNSGKPYNTWIFSLHKLIALATVIVIGLSVYHLYQAMDLQTFIAVAVIAASGLLFLALIVSGSLLSLNISLAGASLKIHQVVPLLALLFSNLTIYLLASSKA